MIVARSGEQADPSEPAPAALRPYLRFAKLPGPALEVARRVLDDDEDFRRRVAASTSEQAVGEPAWLWLTRPAGWEARLEEVVRAAWEEESAARLERTERDIRRRLTRAEDAARRADIALRQHERELTEAREELDRTRTARDQAEADLAVLRTQMPVLRDERNAAVRRMKQVEAELANRSADLRRAQHQLRMAHAELVQREPEVSGPAASPPATAAGNAAAAGMPGAADRERLLAAAEAAAVAARQLTDAAANLASALGAPGAPAAATRTAPSLPARAAVRLPPGVFDDSVAAAEHLVASPGAVLLVDGYNVSHAAWPGTAIADQRERLVTALAELHARTGVDVEVVFDGADVEPAWSGGARTPVRVRFSPAGVEADDVVLQLVDELPRHRPVVVASSDRRVRDGARARGAATVSSTQLLSVLHR